MDQALTKDYIQAIREQLGCSQRIVAQLLGVTPHTLSNNRDKPLTEVSKSTRKKIETLYYIVAKHFVSLRADAIYQIINAHVYEDLKGRTHSVVSAILLGEWPLETVENIADIALDAYNDEKRAQSLDLPYETEVQTETGHLA